MARSVTDIPPLGDPVPDWQPPPRPSDAVIEGRYCRVEPLRAAAHAAPLFAVFDGHDQVWDYLPYGPFETRAAYRGWLHSTETSDDVAWRAVLNKDSGAFEGVATYLRIAPEAGSIEVGHINFAPALQRTRAGTEALLEMMRWAFEAGYRRFEWKCDALNIPSRRAAQRLGLSFEGVFRQAAVIKGRNRDTAWFAATDQDWPGLRAAFDAWLEPGNFTADGGQRQRLSALTAPLLVARDPVLSVP